MKILVLDPYVTSQTFILDPLLLEDREDMRVEELLTSRGLVPILV